MEEYSLNKNEQIITPFPQKRLGYLEANLNNVARSVVTLPANNFSVTTAVANSLSIQAALNKKGVVTIQADSPSGTVAVSGSHIVYSDTKVVIAAGTTIANYTNLSGNNVPIFVNANWQSSGGGVTVSSGITASASSPVIAGYRTATVNCGANVHGLVAGDYALIKGDTTKVFIGIWKVESVINANQFTFLLPAPATFSGSSSGTVTVQKADANITLTGGGVLDYRGQQNQAVYDYRAMGCVFNKVLNLNVNNITILNVPKYGIYYSNLVDPNFSDIECVGPSAAIQGLGFNINVSKTRIKGTTNDDFIAWTGDNQGFPEFDIPNGGTPGPLLGFKTLDIACRKTGAHVVALYPAEITPYEISGVVIENTSCVVAPDASYIYYDTGAFAPNTLTVDVTVRGIFGPTVPSPGNVVKIGGAGTLTIQNFTIENIQLGTTNINSAPISVGNNITIKRLKVAPNSNVNFDATSQQYYVQISNSSVVDSIEFYDCTITQATGSNVVHAVAAVGTHKSITIQRCKFYGQADGLYVAPSGTPDILIKDCYSDTWSGFEANSACTLYYKNNVHRAPSRPGQIILFGNGYNVNLHVENNFWGTAGAWLYAGAPGETVTCEIWALNNTQAGGYGTAINHDGSGAIFLRAMDANHYANAAFFTSIQAGCSFYNNNAAAAPGTGLVIHDGIALKRMKPYTQAVASSATPALNCNLGNYVTFTATAASAWGAPTNVPAAGEIVTVLITQNATGGFAITWNPAYIFPTAFSNTGNGANKKTLVSFLSDGTSLIAQGANVWY